MKNNNLKYDIRDCPKKWYEWILYPIQQVLSVLVATILIANICGTPISSCLVGACIGTLTYQIITKFRSPIFISSCGATVSAVYGALALGNGQNYLAVMIGGLVILVIYASFALFIKFKGIEKFNKLFPPVIVGAITMVIGLNLATFIPTYVHSGSETANWEILVALITMFTVALSSHYFKGFLKTIPFLIGIIVGYAVAGVITACGAARLIEFGTIDSFFQLPDFSFLHYGENKLTWSMVLQVIVLFLPVAICAILEHYSDHKTLSNIIGTDLTVEPGLHRTLLGDGVASVLGTIICGLPNTSYGESIGTVGFSKVASVWILTIAAGLLGILGFIQPVQVFLNSIPSCVFGGCSMILYGYIAASGLKTLVNNKVDFEDNKNLIVVSVILTIGVGGAMIKITDSFNLSGVAFAMLLGVILNLILKRKPTENK